jgi:ornithine cyclodeaminase
MDKLDLKTIKQHLDPSAVMAAIEAAFVSYSEGKVTVPPVGHLPFPGGDCHIKYGYIEGDDYFVIKVASGSHRNTELGISPSSGMMLICSATTGHPVALLEDEGHLTDVRTAMAGAIAAKYLMPESVHCIGVVGRGIQAGLQLEYLKDVTPCRNVLVWNHRSDNIDEFVEAVNSTGFDASVAGSADELASNSNLIVMTTPSTSPLISRDAVKPGTHITAVGADTPGKQELAIDLVSRADVLVVDSVSQCTDHGEIQSAIRAGDVDESDLVELGHVISGSSPGRTSEEQITIADLTGVAVQDISIATVVYREWQIAGGMEGDISLLASAVISTI